MECGHCNVLIRARSCNCLKLLEHQPFIGYLCQSYGSPEQDPWPPLVTTKLVPGLPEQVSSKLNSAAAIESLQGNSAESRDSGFECDDVHLWLRRDALRASRNRNAIETAGVIRGLRIGELYGAGEIRANADLCPVQQVGRGFEQIEQTGVAGDGQIHRAVGCTGDARELRCISGAWLLMFPDS